MKKTWLVLLVLALVAAPALVQAQFEYTTNTDGISITITGYSGPGAAVTIPTNINDLAVTSIGNGENSLFSGSGLTSLTIPGSVTSIGMVAIEDCSSLTNVTISDGVADIGNGAFWNCGGLTGITIPASITNMGMAAFGECSRLTNVTLTYGLTSLGDQAFEMCSAMTSIMIPGTLTNIPVSAFYHCTHLTNAAIASGVTSIGDSAFYISGLTTVTIPSSVTNIAIGAFQGCPALTTVFFVGNAPTFGFSTGTGGAFGSGDGPSATAFYLPGTTGWTSGSNLEGLGMPAVLWNPMIQTADGSFGVQGNQFGFNITGSTNIPIVVEACSNLANPVWTPLQSLALTNGSFFFSEPFQASNSGRFYRISSP